MNKPPAFCPACHAGPDDGWGREIAYPNNPRMSGADTITVPERIVLCDACGFGIADPLLDEEALQRLYVGSQYWQEQKPRPYRDRDHPLQAALGQARWRLIVSSTPGTPIAERDGLTLLDIGAGFGFLGMAAARSLGTGLRRHVAIEPDPTVRSSLEITWRQRGFLAELSLAADTKK